MIENKNGKIILVTLGVLGALSMSYLVYLHYSSGGDSAFCNLGEGLSCSAVNQSIYSEIFLIPMSVLGFLYFLGVIGITLWRYNKDYLRKLAFFTIAFLGPSIYLTIIELFVINEVCVFCEFSKVLMIAVIVTALVLMKPEKMESGFVAGAIVLALIFGGVSYISHRGNVPSGKYAEFAGCLYDKGFVMYGSEGCLYCAKQRAMFGDAFQFIEEIECDSHYKGAEWERCVAKNIAHTPTWIQEDAEGNELFRFPAGVVELDDLSAQSGCPLLVE